jgi:ketosteroid isomerase-like protein
MAPDVVAGFALAAAYLEAWAELDADRAAAFHTPDTVYHLHGSDLVVAGRQAVREHFRRRFADMPDMRLEVRALRFGSDHIVLEATTVGHSRLFGPSRLESVDILLVTDGAISRKDVYVASRRIRMAQDQ